MSSQMNVVSNGSQTKKSQQNVVSSDRRLKLA